MFHTILIAYDDSPGARDPSGARDSGQDDRVVPGPLPRTTSTATCPWTVTWCTDPPRPFVLRVSSDALVGMGIRAGDELLVDRALNPAPGRVLVVIVDAERRLGRFDLVDGQAVLATDLEQIPLTADDEPRGVATVLLHHLPLGPAGDRGRRNVAR